MYEPATPERAVHLVCSLPLELPTAFGSVCMTSLLGNLKRGSTVGASGAACLHTTYFARSKFNLLKSMCYSQ